MDSVEGWHFLRPDGCLNYPPHTKVKVEKALTIEGKPVLCERGLHASVRAIDALQYAPGPIVCRVRVGGEIVTGDDKLCGTERTVLWMADASDVLHHFACDVAEEAMRSRGVKDKRSWAAIEAKRGWLAGHVSDADLDAAWVAARAAAWDAARAAARDAAWDAARDAARDGQNTELERRLMELHRGA